ncbi:MAG: hypothetical protein OEZ68_20155 [Gammaproteobacteria bacterium]|nr:hypothetical protein [Gammaproteobacteria bacterium]MDH5803123.1 hypothetical protein [Gammaproteobacteria bacterium]
MISFTLSMRGKLSEQALLPYISDYYRSIPHANIDSVFGFVEKSTLYGGRQFVCAEISPKDVQVLYQLGIGLRLPLTNKYVERNDYEDNRAFLEKYHRTGNSVIVVSDDLAKWIRAEYPDYHIEASVIKNIKHNKKIERALEIYDTVVLPAKLSNDYSFLEKVTHKESIRLFANAGCAYNCPSKICYNYMAKSNLDETHKLYSNAFACSKTLLPRKELGMVEFDVARLSYMGFSKFKLLRSNEDSGTGF